MRVERHRRKSMVRVLAVTATLCGAAASAPEAGRCDPEIVLHNGRIFTVDAAQPWAEAVAICGDRIALVGRSADVLAGASRDARRIDLQRRLVVPGFNDSHVHLVDGATALVEVDLRGAASAADSRGAPAGLREDAAEGKVDSRRLLGSRGVAGEVAADPRGHRRPDARPPGVRPAAGRAHGARQQPCAEARRHHPRHPGPRRRRHRPRCRRRAGRRPQGQRDGPRHARRAAADARGDDDQGAGRARPRRTPRRHDDPGHDDERDGADRLPAAARRWRAAGPHHVAPEPAHRRPGRRRHPHRLWRRLAAHRRHQAVCRRRDGVGHGRLLRAVRGRPVDLRAADRVARGARAQDAGRRRGRLPADRARDWRQGQRDRPRHPDADARLRVAGLAPAHRARAGRAGRRQGTLRGARRHRLDSADPLHRRHALGGEAHRPRPRRRGLRLQVVRDRRRPDCLRHRLVRRAARPDARALRRGHAAVPRRHARRRLVSRGAADAGPGHRVLHGGIGLRRVRRVAKRTREGGLSGRPRRLVEEPFRHPAARDPDDKGDADDRRRPGRPRRHVGAASTNRQSSIPNRQF